MPSNSVCATLGGSDGNLENLLMVDMTAFNKPVIDEFRANGGKVGGDWKNAPLMLLTTVGAKTGTKRTVPLVHTRDGDRVIIIASFAGAAHHPPWFHNVSKNPDVVVELPGDTFEAHASVLDEPERSEQFAKMAALMPVFNDYQAKTDRVIPVVALTRR